MLATAPVTLNDAENCKLKLETLETCLEERKLQLRLNCSDKVRAASPSRTRHRTRGTAPKAPKAPKAGDIVFDLHFAMFPFSLNDWMSGLVC